MSSRVLKRTLSSPRRAGLRAGRQMQVEPAKSRLRGPLRAFHLPFRQAILLGNGLKPFPTAVPRNRPAPCLTRRRTKEIPRTAGLMVIFQQPVFSSNIRTDPNLLPDRNFPLGPILVPYYKNPTRTLSCRERSDHVPGISQEALVP